LVADAGAIQTPTLMIAAGKDWVVSLNAQQTFFNRLSSTDKRFEIFPDSYHAIFHETSRRDVTRIIGDFVRNCFNKPATPPSLLDADKTGYTAQEHECLRNNGSRRFAVARAGLKVAGRLSRGIEIGWRSGFDSGLSLDYVYKNEATGWSPLGRIIDKSYLNSIGWRGIRQRKENLNKILRDLILKVRRENESVRILDVAAGAGRYVIETIRDMPNIPIGATLCDYKQENVDAVRALANELNVNGAVIARRGDAFDRESLANIRPRATIGIVSGLYELIPSNESVLNSLRGLADAIEPDGYLIYTNQPWHPQLEFIAHVLVNREGERWIMRRRTTAEMDQLVRAAGFEKIDMEIDQWGMFTVSVARRGR
jgi:SAM-dependent methyltransferase